MSGELLVMMAKFMPEDKLVEDIIEKAQEYKMMPDDKEKRMSLAASCALFGAKISIEGKDTIEVLRELKQAEQTKDFLNPDKNPQ